jgi:hypothetical protein
MSKRWARKINKTNKLIGCPTAQKKLIKYWCGKTTLSRNRIVHYRNHYDYKTKNKKNTIKITLHSKKKKKNYSTEIDDSFKQILTMAQRFKLYVPIIIRVT